MPKGVFLFGLSKLQKFFCFLYTMCHMSTTIDILGKIIGSQARVKLMRLFLFHPGYGFSRDELLKKTKVTSSVLRAEISLLEKAEFIVKKEMIKVVFTETKKKVTSKKKKMTVYMINDDFPLLDQLQSLLLESELITLSDLPQRFKKAGKIKLLVISGIFMKDPHRTVDMVFVGDKLDTNFIQKNMSLLESEVGKELRYATFTTEEFLYRIKMYDKLIRDVFDYPHHKVINQMTIPQLS